MSWTKPEVKEAQELVKGDRFYMAGRAAKLRRVTAVILDGTRVTISSEFVHEGRPAQVMHLTPDTTVIRVTTVE